MLFQHTAARRRLLFVAFAAIAIGDSFNTQPPEGGCSLKDFLNHPVITVSTHSRPKAAAKATAKSSTALGGFNTQPPEGGCFPTPLDLIKPWEFQHTAARRRLRALGFTLC